MSSPLLEAELNLLPNFSANEFRCQCDHCGHSLPEDQTSTALRLCRTAHAIQQVRTSLGRPIIINSAYRCDEHPLEAQKEAPGSHASGHALDIRETDPQEQERLIQSWKASSRGRCGIGRYQSHIHLDNGHLTANRPASWGNRKV